MVFALHAGLGCLLEEGLEQSWKRHGDLRPGAAGRAASGSASSCSRRTGHRLPELTTVWVPEAHRADEAQLRRLLLDRYGIEIGGGLGRLRRQGVAHRAHGPHRPGPQRRRCCWRAFDELLGRPRRGSPAGMTLLRGRRISLRPLVPTDFGQYAEVRKRNGEWLTKWEPARLPGQPDPADSYDAFVARCSRPPAGAPARHRLRLRHLRRPAARRRDQPVVGAAGRVPERLRRLLGRRGAAPATATAPRRWS